jgi:eukaryotic-like serine/threonine-protein kinase
MPSENIILNGRYRLISRVGAGGMSVVYKAQDLALGRLVAIKILHPSLTGDPQFLERFQREAQAAASLSHPNIVTVHDVGEDGDRHYIVMELVEGDDLKTVIRHWAPLPLNKALDLAIQICDGVGYAHRAGFVHCDVKPQNVLVTQDGWAKVADFGIARAISEATMSRSDLAWGTPHYFSPEQAAGLSATPASDVYAIGVILFEMLTGRLPFEAGSATALALKHLQDEPPSITDFNPAVPLPVAKIVAKVLSKEPAGRYRTANQLGQILDAYRTSGSEVTGAVPIPTGLSASPIALPAAAAELARTTRPSAVTSYPEEEAAQYEETGGVDWMAIFLGTIALLAILGLIPLWVYVYQVYQRPSPPPEVLPLFLYTISATSGIIF